MEYRKLEQIQANNAWHTLGLPKWCSYDWLLCLQTNLCARGLATDAVRRTLSDVVTIAKHMPQEDGDLDYAVYMDAVMKAVSQQNYRKRSTVKQMANRMLRSANTVWYEILGTLKTPLPRSLLGRVLLPKTASLANEPPPKAFTEEEVQCLLRTAEDMGTRDAVFLHILLTTGVRLEAARRLCWGNVNFEKQRMVMEEKNKKTHVTILTPTCKYWLMKWRKEQTNPGVKYVFARYSKDEDTPPITQRTLRERFYAICRAAGIQGSHCHPHNTRRSVSHLLYLAGNSVSQISKFLGHSSLGTTERYYLQLSLDELLPKMTIPWFAAPTSHLHCDNSEGKVH